MRRAAFTSAWISRTQPLKTDKSYGRRSSSPKMLTADSDIGLQLVQASWKSDYNRTLKKMDFSSELSYLSKNWCTDRSTTFFGKKIFFKVQLNFLNKPYVWPLVRLHFNIFYESMSVTPTLFSISLRSLCVRVSLSCLAVTRALRSCIVNPVHSNTGTYVFTVIPNTSL